MDGSEQVAVDAKTNRVTVTFERSLYPLDVVYGAAYIFIDRCFVLLDAPEETRLTVTLTGRQPLDEAALRALAGEFGNEVLTQIWRQETVRQNLSVIEVVTARALAGAQDTGVGGLAALGGAAGGNGDRGAEEGGAEPIEDDLADAFDDPLGIAVPWEEKYGKGDDATQPAAGAEAKDGADDVEA